MDEDKLKDELALSNRREEGLKRELEEVKTSMAKMASSTEKLNCMLGVGKRPSDNRGLSYFDDKEASSSSDITFVKSMDFKKSPPPQHLRKKIDLGKCSRSAQVKVAPKGQAHDQPKRAPHANFPQPKIH